MDTPDIKVVPNPEPSNSASSSLEWRLLHQCRETTEQTYSSRSDEPLDSPEVEWLTNGSSFVEMGTRKVGYTVVLLDKVVESKTVTRHQPRRVN